MDSSGFQNDWNNCPLPTDAALPQEDRDDDEKIEILQIFTKLVVLPKSKTIVVMEPKP